MQKLIIDVSEHQKHIDWEKVKPKIDGAIIRCGYGDDEKSQDDKYWEYNVKECERLGIPYGVYLYSYADSDAHAKSEVAHALRLLKGHKPSYPVYIDLEEPKYGSFARRAADIFCKAMKDAGFVPGFYTYQSFYDSFLAGYSAYTLWIASFADPDVGKPTAKPYISAKYDAWQYTSAAVFPGITENTVDVSYFYREWKSTSPSTPSSTSTGTAAKVLEVAKSQLGVTDGTKYGKWYEKNVDKDIYNYDFGASGVPWCAMFTSWVFNQAKAVCAGLPGAYCPTMLQEAKNAKKTVTAKNAKPGDVVYFDWDGGVCDHVGIVESNDGSKLHTIEGNTDNGIVAQKVRAYSTVAGVVRPDYSSSDVPDTKPIAKPAPTFRVSVVSSGKTWLAAKKLKKGSAIRWIAIKNAGRYRVYTQASRWLPWIDACNVNDLEYGCAGDGSKILAVQIERDDIRYAVRPIGGKWYPDMIGLHDTGGSPDTFAGDLRNAIDGFSISLN